LIAAPSGEHYFRLHRELETRRHDGGAAVWQVIRGCPECDGERTPRDRRTGEDLLLAPGIRNRIDTEVIRFFDAEVAALYRDLNVLYRRGVLLHGPPGNGKTSTIRHIGASLPRIPAMILRPDANFDSDDLQLVLDRWRRQAPAILVIEDLNWLLEKVNVSTFLNLIDGVETVITGGLLLIATTNHPHKLDPAVNNRPGRFDVVIEVPCPDRGLRAEFFRRKWAGAASESIERITVATERLSFAHLQEILRLSGLYAIKAGRRGRTEPDLLEAARIVQAAQNDADRGFTPRPDAPFGLAAWRDR
jgi:SpoVK/Ycf46/Vps4 family AAA+-type ATPase